MYQRYADLHGWKFDADGGEPGRSRRLQGSHRQDHRQGRLCPAEVRSRACTACSACRRPKTQGRIHTSAATVAVLPEVEDIDIEIRTEDIRIDTMRSSGAGGQHVNTTDSAVRITHLPIGHRRDRRRRRASTRTARTAMKVLRARLYEEQRDARDTARSDSAQGAGGLGRSLGAHPHLQFPAGPGDRPPHQPDALQARQGDRRRSARRADRGADHRDTRRRSSRRWRGSPERADHRGGLAGGARPVPARPASKRRNSMPGCSPKSAFEHGPAGAGQPRARRRAGQGSSKALEALAARRLSGEPVARILGEQGVLRA